MRIDQPHLSVKAPNESKGVAFLEKKLEETQEVVNTLIEGRESIQSFLKRQNIDEAVVAEKMSVLSTKIEYLSNAITELKQILDACTDDLSVLYQYLKEHAENDT